MSDHTPLDRSALLASSAVHTACLSLSEHRILAEQLMRAAGGVGYHTSEAMTETGDARIFELRRAEKEAREVLYWLSLFEEGRWMEERLLYPLIKTYRRLLAALTKKRREAEASLAKTPLSPITESLRLSTPSLLIRLPSQSDEALFEGAAEALLPTLTTEERRARLASYRREGDHFTVIDRATEELRGLIRLAYLFEDRSALFLELSLLPEKHTERDGEEILSAMSSYLFDTKGLSLLLATESPDGFTEYALVKADFTLDGRLRRADGSRPLYSLTEADYRRTRSRAKRD